MNRGNKLWEGHRMIIPEHRKYMMEREDRQQLMERPTLDEDKLNEMSQTLCEAIERGVLVTVKVFRPEGYVDVEMVPQRVVDGKLRGVDRDGRQVRIEILNIIDVVL